MKVSIIGAGGNVGSTIALALAKRNFLKEIVMLDIEKKVDDKIFYPSKARALDQWQTSSIHGFETYLRGTTEYSDTQDSKVCIITAGVPRKPGMNREDLLEINAKIVKNATQEIINYSPRCILVIVSNPLDIMSYVAYLASEKPKNEVVGMAGLLDTARYCAAIATELNISPNDIQAQLLGGHGDTMVPLPRYTTVGGIPISQFLNNKTLNKIIERTKYGGGELVKLMGTSAWYAPGAATARMVESILLDQRRIYPCCVYLEGEYNINNIFLGVPVVLGKNGVEKIIEISLNKNERNLFDSSVNHVKHGLSEFKKMNIM